MDNVNGIENARTMTWRGFLLSQVNPIKMNAVKNEIHASPTNRPFAVDATHISSTPPRRGTRDRVVKA